MNFTNFLKELDKDALNVNNMHIRVVKRTDKSSGRPLIDIRRKGKAPHLDISLAEIGYSFSIHGKASRYIKVYSPNAPGAPMTVCQNGIRMASILLTHLGQNMDVSGARKYFEANK